MSLATTSYDLQLKPFAEVEDFFRTSYHMLVNFASRFVKDRDDAQEIVSDSLVKALANYGSYEPGTNFKAWFFRITKNTALDFLGRSETRNSRYGLDLDDVVAIHGSDLSYQREDQEQIVGRLQENRYLYDRFEELIDKRITNSDQKLAVTLRYLDGLSYEAMAVETGWPIGTVMSRLNRGTRAMGIVARNNTPVRMK
jgi:RNA polymerase sigma-70 factor, ECF subfamily